MFEIQYNEFLRKLGVFSQGKVKTSLIKINHLSREIPPPRQFKRTTLGRGEPGGLRGKYKNPPSQTP